MSIFDKIEDFAIEESLEQKIMNLKLTQFTQRRKDELFKRFREEQERNLVTRRKEAERSYANRDFLKLSKNEFTLSCRAKTETFKVGSDDLDKLRPDTDLNDIIVGYYLKIFNCAFLSPALEERSYFFNSYLIEKLIDRYTNDDAVSEVDSKELIAKVQERVNQNYKNVQRWTKSVDIFEKEIVVIPINAFRHWFCVLILRPHCLLDCAEPMEGEGRGKAGHKEGEQSQKCEIVYCDSMCEKREFIVAAVRQYLQIEAKEKKRLKLRLNEDNVPCYQLLVSLP